jgi:gluconokinase
MKVPELRSPYDRVGDLVYFGRMLNRIRHYQSAKPPAEYLEMYGGGFDERTCDFLYVTFDALSERVRKGGSDGEILAWCFSTGRRPSDEEREVWNGFMEKRGWRDPMVQMIQEELEAKGWSHRKDIKTLFDCFDADEDRPLRYSAE